MDPETLRQSVYEVQQPKQPQLEIILSVITSIPTGQRTSLLSVSLSYLGRPLISFHTASALSSISEERETLVDPGEDQDEVIRTSQGMGLILCYTRLEARGVQCLVRLRER